MIFQNTIYSGIFIKHVEFSDSSSSGTSGTFADGAKYTIKNLNSGLYLQVDSAKAENGVNVIQGETSEESTTEIWKLIDIGEGYYCFIIGVGDSNSFALHVACNSSDQGSTIESYQYSGDNSQQFIIAKNLGGSYIS